MNSKARPFPWLGRIRPWSAALRSQPNKNPHAPSQGVVADLPRGTQVTVVGQHGGWLRVKAPIAGGTREGYVSQELVDFISSTAAPTQKPPLQAPAPIKRRLFFAIYYRSKDNAFKRAADTWEAETRKAFAVNPNAVDIFLSIEVVSEADFKMAWNKINSESRGKFAKVIEGQIFSHASRSHMGSGADDGLEFKKDPSDDGTVKRSEIGGLARLDWDSQGSLILAGCNSGVTEDRGWAPAKTFADTQKVRTIGQTGYAYFSTNPGHYEEINSGSSTVYLWAFKRRQNAWFGDGGRLEGKVFEPSP